MNKREVVTKFFSFFVLLLILLLLLWIVIPSGYVSRHNWLVMTTFLINGVLWTFLLLYELGKHPYSFSVIHWTFFLLFFFFAAIVQYMNNDFPWVGYRSDFVIIDANLILMLWTVGVIIGQYTKISAVEHQSKVKEKLGCNLECDQTLILVVITIVIALIRIKTVGFANLLSRGTS